MKQHIDSINLTDENGNPTGGSVIGKGIHIEWQDGPLVVDGARKEPNGAFVDGVIAAAIDRLEFYQASRFNCSENQIALDHLNQAMAALESRTNRRVKQGVEGTHQGT